jgi:PPOX class probable F420-dependent enzyme
MTAQFPASVLDLFERPIICALSTVNSEGQPHTVPVWCDFDGTHVRVNAPAATKKAKDMQVNSKVAVLLVDPGQPYHWVEIRGHILEVRNESQGAREHINSLSLKYMGNPVYPGFGNSNIDRLMYVIEADKINGQ